MSKVLLLIAEFYPYQNATASCLINICEQLKTLDETISFDVLCFKTNADDPDESVYKFFRIRRITKFPLIDKKSYFNFVEKSKFSFFKKLFMKTLFVVKKIVYRSVERISLRPWRFAYKDYYKALKSFGNDNDYNYVIAVSGNYSIAYSGAMYKKYCQREIILATYLTDPLIGNPLFANRSKKRMADEFAFICGLSDKLVVTPLIMNDVPNCDKAIAVEFPSFFENEKYSDDFANIKYDKNVINLLYTGTFYPKIRNPEYLMKLIELSDKRIVLHICGTISSYYLKRYKNLIDCGKLIVYGNLSHQLLFNAICDCDFLVNIGNSTNTMLPSKLISYLSTGKPIINIVKIQDCPTIEYLKNYSEHLNIYEFQDIKTSLKSLDTFLNSKHETIPKEVILSKYICCTKKHITEKFYSHIFQ